MSPDVLNSHARSALKIVGTGAIFTGLAAAFEHGGVMVAIYSIIGTASVMWGLGWSHLAHTPPGGPEVKLRSLAPDAVPADVAARMASTPPPKGA